MNNKGSIQLIVLIVLVSLVVGIFLFQNKDKFIFNKQSVAVVITKTASPSATVAPTLTLTPTPIPTVVPTILPTAKPVAQGVSGPPGAGFSSMNVATEKGNFSASVLMIDLNGAKIVTDTANDSDCADSCPTLTLQDFVNRNGGFAGVNGSYFCPDSYPDCASKKNSFDFPVYNSKLNKWINQGNLFWDNRAIVYFDGTGAHYLQNAKDFNGGLSAGITNYPGLLNNRSVQIDDNQSGLSDKQKAKGTKVGIGVSGNRNVMVVIAQDVNMLEFAHVFKSLGAQGALNLDTGGSTALYYNGRYLAGPGRNLPNAIIFTR